MTPPSLPPELLRHVLRRPTDSSYVPTAISRRRETGRQEGLLKPCLRSDHLALPFPSFRQFNLPHAHLLQLHRDPKYLLT